MRDNPWKGLPPGEPGKLSALRIPELPAIEAFWARKPDGRLTLLIVLRRMADVPAEVPAVRGVEILVLPADSHLQLVLEPAGDWEMFHALCTDLLAATKEADGEAQALQLLFARLLRWQKFLSKSTGKLLDEREVRGLIGELLFLRDQLLPVRGPAAVQCWQGPLGLPQDFVFDGRLVEVKTFAAGADPSIRIASPEQLSSAGVPLFLHLVCLVRNDSGMNLASVVDEIRRLLADDSKQFEAFEDRLMTMGYLDLPEYRSTSYSITSVCDYEVRDGFPRLTVDQVPSGVTDVAYAIRISDMRPFVAHAGALMGSTGCTA